MNPIVQSQLASLLRSLMWVGATLLVKKGLLTGTQAEGICEALATAAVALAWSYWKNHTNRVKVLTALTMPVGSTENDLKEKVASGATPAILTPVNQPPEAAQPKEIKP